MPEPRELLPHLVEALRGTFGDRLRCVLLTGSVKRGDWLRSWSDLDLHLFLEQRPPAGLEPKQICDVQERLASLDPAAYGLTAVQVRTFDASGYPAWFAEPWPGTTEPVWGVAPAAPDVRKLAVKRRDMADDTLAGIDRAVSKVSDAWITAPDEKLPGILLGLGSILKDALIGAGIVLVGPRRALTATRDDLVKSVSGSVGDQGSARRFFAFAKRWELVRTQPSNCRQMFEEGFRAVTVISSWAAARTGPSLMGRQIAEARRRRGWSQRTLAERAGVSVDSVRLVEGETYRLQKEPRYPPVLELIARSLDMTLVGLLRLRPDAEIADSAFAHLIDDVRRRRLEPENGPRPEE